MPSSLPTPVAAALGIVPTVLGGVRRLPGKAVQLPIFAVSSALTTLDTARREYDALAERGERLVARLRGQSFDELEDRFEDALQDTPLARPYDALEDALEDATESVTKLVRSAPAAAKKKAPAAAKTASATIPKAPAPAGNAPTKARRAAGTASRSTGRVLDRAADAVEDAAETATDAVAPEQAPKGAPTPKATQPDSARVDTAATPDVVEAVERVSSVVGGVVLEHDELPLPDYDHLTLGSLRGRMRSLDLPQLVQIRDYEKAHADRLPIVTMLDNRIAKLAADPTAPLSGSSPTDRVPAKNPGTATGSPVTPATSGPPMNPPSQGDPTNPAQPR